MAKNIHPLSEEEFHAIYMKVPRLTVEILLRNADGRVYATRRLIEPCKGQWHLPGGTVRFGENLFKAVQRIAKRELHITVESADQCGYIDYPSHYQHGLDSPVGIVFEVTEYSGTLRTNSEASAGEWFGVVPKNMHADQDVFLIDNGYLLRDEA